MPFRSMSRFWSSVSLTPMYLMVGNEICSLCDELFGVWKMIPPGLALMEMRARMFDQPARSQAAAPVNKGAPAVPAAPGATALTSSQGSQPTIR